MGGGGDRVAFKTNFRRSSLIDMRNCLLPLATAGVIHGFVHKMCAVILEEA